MMRWIGSFLVVVLASAGCGPAGGGGDDGLSSPGSSGTDDGSGPTTTDGGDGGSDGDGDGGDGGDDGDGGSDGDDGYDGSDGSDGSDGDDSSDGGEPPVFDCTDVDLGDALPGLYTGPTGDAATGLELVCGDQLFDDTGLWFEWTAPEDGTFRLTVEGPGLSPAIARVPSCGSDFGACPVSDLELDLLEGESILFAVTELDGATGELTVTIDIAFAHPIPSPVR